jgi:hypothetical protein
VKGLGTPLFLLVAFVLILLAFAWLALSDENIPPVDALGGALVSQRLANPS